MGAWGTSLYENDTTCDIRDDYIDKLKRGKSNEEATNELICQYREIKGDVEEEPLFWYALADTQWEYGRLLPEVKAKALLFLGRKEELERWKESGEEKCRAWMETLAALKEKLNSPVPEAKKFRGIVFTVALGLSEMYLPIDLVATIVKKKAFTTNMLFLEKSQKTLIGRDMLYLLCKYTIGLAR